jgi:hypothetical protein
MKRTKKYDGEEGSLVESDEMTPAQRIEFSEKTGSTGPAKTMSFKEAFASARGAGDKTFEWQGKKYTTELAPSKPAKPAEPAPKTTKAVAPEYKPTKATEPVKPRSFRSDLDELAKSNSSLGNVNMLAKGRMAPEKKYAKGGSVSSASKRADGCAVKGKTKGRFV